MATEEALTCSDLDLGDMNCVFQLQQSFGVDWGLREHGVKTLDVPQSAAVKSEDFAAENLT